MKKGLTIGLAVLMVLVVATIALAKTNATVEISGTVGGDFWATIKGYQDGTHGSSGPLEGQQGAQHEFEGHGSWTFNTFTSTVSELGALHTIVNAQSTSGANLKLSGWQDFEVTGGNIGSRLSKGELVAQAMGSSHAKLDVDFTGSMYLFKDHGPYTYGFGGSNWMLEGKGTSYDVLHSTQVYNKADPTDVYGATIVELWQDSVVGPVAGIAAASDEGMLGFNTAWAFSTQHASTYYPVSTTCYMQAFGAGNNYQYTYAKNGGTHNGAAFGGPGAQTTSGWFTGGYTNNPSGSGN